MEEENLGPEALTIAKNTQAKLDLGPELSEIQKTQMREIEEEFEEVFSVRPGRTLKVVHKIETPAEVVVRSGGRNWPYHLRKVIDEEVAKMIELGVVEHSQSPWRSHPVLVPK